MATDAAPIPALRKLVVNAPAREVGSAETRILGQFAIFIGAGYIAYLVIASGYFAAAFRVSALWWSIPGTVAVFASGIAIGVAGVMKSVRAIQITTTVALLVFLATIALWPLAWNGGLIDDAHGLWFVQFNGLPALAAALIWRVPRSLLYLWRSSWSLPSTTTSSAHPRCRARCSPRWRSRGGSASCRSRPR